MGLKEKLKFAGKTIIISALGFMAGANIYNLLDFEKNMNYIGENPNILGSVTNRKTYAERYIRENKGFPNNILTFLSRQDAKSFISLYQ